MPSFTQESELGVPARRVWLAMKDSKELFPKIAPQLFSSIEYVEGTPVGAVGSERIIKFGPIAPSGAYVKEKLIAVDEAKFTLTIEEVEAGHLARGYTKYVSTVKFVTVTEESSKMIATVDYEGGDEASIAQAKEGYAKLSQGVASYLQANAVYT